MAERKKELIIHQIDEEIINNYLKKVSIKDALYFDYRKKKSLNEELSSLFFLISTQKHRCSESQTEKIKSKMKEIVKKVKKEKNPPEKKSNY